MSDSYQILVRKTDRKCTDGILCISRYVALYVILILSVSITMYIISKFFRLYRQEYDLLIPKYIIQSNTLQDNYIGYVKELYFQ